MKRILCFILALLVICLPLTATAADDEFKIKTPKGFVSAKVDSDKTDLAKIFSTTADELDRYFKQNNILYIAANSDYSQQIFLTAETTDFSKKTVSFSRFSEEDLKSFAVSLAGDSFENGGIITGKSNTPFIKLTLKDSGEFNIYEYITVCSSKLYTLRISTDTDNDRELFEQFFKTLSIEDCATAKNTAEQSAYTLIAAAGIAVFATVAAILTFTVIRDVKRRKNETEDTEDNGEKSE